jgi:hypothetical protein
MEHSIQHDGLNLNVRHGPVCVVTAFFQLQFVQRLATVWDSVGF